MSCCGCFGYKKPLLSQKETPPPTQSHSKLSQLADKLAGLFSKKRASEGSQTTKQVKLKNVKIDKKGKYQQQEEDTRKVKIRRDSDGNKVVNQYVLLKTIGSGAYGKVKLCVNTDDNQYYAMKILKRSVLLKRRVGMKKGGPYEDVMREIQLMKRMSHPNIIQLHEVINDPNDDHIFIVMEYAEHGSILKGEPEDFTPVPEDKGRKYFRDALAAVEYIHGLKIIHRDIKPENLLITHDDIAKLSDFGVSTVMELEDDEIFKRTVGSPAFIAPELCSEAAKVLGPPLDIWGLGVTLYCIIFGKLPFVGDTESQLYDNIRDKKALYPFPVSMELEDLLCQLLTKDPEKRITITDLKIHPWVVGTKMTMSGRSRNPSQDSATSTNSR